MSKSLVQEQFGATARTYLTSKPHAQGKSLDRLVELTQPKRDWHVLDVATGAGHTAYTPSPHVARAWATDITEERLSLVRGQMGKRGLGNLRVAHAKAEALPFEDESFDLVTCRIAPHHFESIPRFLDEAPRVRALARPEPHPRLDHAGMARRALRARLRRGARGADGKDDRVFQLGGPPRRDHAAPAALDAGPDDARRRRRARASGQGGRTHLPAERRRVHSTPRRRGVTNKPSRPSARSRGRRFKQTPSSRRFRS